MATNLVVKIKYNEETRRITLDKVPTYQELLDLLHQLFPETVNGGFQVKYEDEDKDMITVSTDKEIVEAVNVAMKSKVLRLTLVRTYLFAIFAIFCNIIKAFVLEIVLKIIDQYYRDSLSLDQQNQEIICSHIANFLE
jgi:hypothetical protein